MTLKAFLDRALVFLRQYSVVLIFIALVLIGVFSYAFGLRITGSGIVQTGALYMEGLPNGTAVYTDQSRLTMEKGGKVRIDLLPGGHTVIVDAPNMQPWNELFTVQSGKNAVLSPLFVPKEPVLRQLGAEDLAKASTAILSYALPTKAAPLSLADGCAVVYVANNRILADAAVAENCTTPPYLLCPVEEGGERTEACPSSTVIFPPNEYIESVAPFPGRNDAIVVAAGSQAYVVELDPRAPQFFAPILKGPRVRSAPWNDTSVVITDTTKVYELLLVP